MHIRRCRQCKRAMRSEMRCIASYSKRVRSVTAGYEWISR